MAFDPTSLYKMFLVEITLPGLTLYLSRAGEYVTAIDGTAYDGKITALTPLRRSAGGLRNPTMVLPSMEMSIDNKADQNGANRFQDYLDDYQWANAPVVCRIGQGTKIAGTDHLQVDLSVFEVIWEAIAQFPDGVSVSDTAVTIRLNDARSKDARTLPPRVAVPTLSGFASMGAAWIGQPIPMVYGSWLSADANGEKLPCMLKDSTVGLGGKWKIADHAIKSIAAVYKNGASVAFTADLANGEFTLDVTYSAATDTITCHCTGATVDGTPSGALLQTMPEIYRDVLVTWCGVSSADVDATALADWTSNLTADDYARRFINTEVNSHDVLLAELLLEGFADASLEAGSYYPRYRIVNPSASLPLYQEEDLLYSGDGKSGRDFTYDRDPERVYCNEAYGYYAWDPIAGEHASRTSPVSENTGAIATVGARHRQTLFYNWLYKTAGAKTRTDRQVMVFSSNIELASVGVSARALVEGPADQFRLIYSKYVEVAGLGQPFQIRDIDVDLWAFIVKMKAWWTLGLAAGTWTEDAATTWLTATADEREVKGFWTDDNGYADTVGPLDEASKRYKFI